MNDECINLLKSNLIIIIIIITTKLNDETFIFAAITINNDNIDHHRHRHLRWKLDEITRDQQLSFLNAPMFSD